MKKIKAKEPKAIRSRTNSADSIDATAERIAASLRKQNESQDWDQAKIEHLRSCDGKVGEIPISLIRTNQNIRKRIDENDPAFLALIESVRTHGILHPPIVTVVTNENEIPSILLVGGERRLRAAMKAGHTAINCMVRIFDTHSTRLTASIAENMNRKDLECLDIGHCFHSLSEQGYKYSEIEKLFNRDEKTIGRYIKMAKWPISVQERIRDHSEKFTARHLLSLASKKLTDGEIEREIDAKIDGLNTVTGNGPSNRQAALMQKFKGYCERNHLGKQQKDLILNALLELGVISTDGATKSIAQVAKTATTSKKKRMEHTRQVL